MWIEHPWIFYRRANGVIEISGYSESDLGDFNDIQAKFKLPEKGFVLELKKIRDQQNEFENRIFKILDKMKIFQAKETSKLLAGNK
ncbi:hypothetical protein LEP1GSC125_3659 [Leptospira mayottensis 200901122]|uniref:Uncharacterized protein n=2 Tax=Leptospira mayottensis TaxID=1137606 RepID=A0AA87SVQ0_9LEPT|nr:hypothetical protein DQM28_19225 [Leptospira mayottensis]EKR99194.1 hypothetical protein LEP1GSC125_3659 [Leptospira mayottensis 200901122]